MQQTNIRIARLQEMIALEEKRAVLQNNIAVINERLTTIQNELYGPDANLASAKETFAPARITQAKKNGKRKYRGELKSQILEILHAAGKGGASVKELAERIGVKAANVYSWFSINMKKIGGLKKVGAGRFAFNGKIKEEKKGKKEKNLKKGKAKKVKTERGQLKQQILGALKTAGPKGISVKDLADQLKVNYKNIYIWFLTTGKKIAGVKKIGPAKYKLEA